MCTVVFSRFVCFFLSLNDLFNVEDVVSVSRAVAMHNLILILVPEMLGFLKFIINHTSI